MKMTRRAPLPALLAAALLLNALSGCSRPGEDGAAAGPPDGTGSPTATYTEAIPFEYDDAYDFSDGLAAVCLDGRWGFIDKSGAEVIPFIYDLAQPFSEGLAAVRLEADGLIGYIDTTGAEVIAPTFDAANPFSEGLAAVQIGDNEGLDQEICFIDKTGAIVTPFYYSAESFSEGMAMVQHGMSNYLWIDHSGTELFGAGGTNRGTSFHEGMAMIYHFENQCFIDATGNEVISLAAYPGINDVKPFSEGLALVHGYRPVAPEDMPQAPPGVSMPPMPEPDEDGMYRESVDGYIDQTGELVIELPSLSIGSSFSEGMAAVWTASGGYHGYGYIDKTGAFVIEPNPDWDWAYDFHGGYAAVQSADNGLWGFIDKDGRLVVPCDYEIPEYYPLQVSEGMAAVSLNGRWGYIRISE